MPLANGITQYDTIRSYGRYYKGFRTPKAVRLFTAWGTLLSISFLLIQGVKATYHQIHPITVAAEAPKTIEKIVEIDNKDRTTRLQNFLKSKNSPLAGYAQLIVDEADEHGIDYTFITAIAGMESQYCTRIPAGSHNCWGIGGAGNMRFFGSWEQSIKYVSALLGNEYKYNMAKGVQRKYCPTADCEKYWAETVTGMSKEVLSTAVKE